MLAWTFPQLRHCPAFSSVEHVIKGTPECQQKLDTAAVPHQKRSHQSPGGESDETECLTAALIPETQACRSVRDEAKALGPFTTISTEPLTWAISCNLLFSTDQHYTPHTELGYFMVLFTPGCLSCLPSTFLPGAIYPQHHFSGLIKAVHTATGSWTYAG